MREDWRLVERLRGLRVVPSRDVTLAGPLAGIAASLRRRSRNLGALGAAWAELLPADLQGHTHLVGLNRGVLTVRCADSATRFEVDRWLRSGGELALIKRAAARLTRVRATL